MGSFRPSIPILDTIYETGLACFDRAEERAVFALDLHILGEGRGDEIGLDHDVDA